MAAIDPNTLGIKHHPECKREKHPPLFSNEASRILRQEPLDPPTCRELLGYAWSDISKLRSLPGYFSNLIYRIQLSFDPEMAKMPLPEKVPGHCLLGSLPDLSQANDPMEYMLSLKGKKGLTEFSLGPKLFYLVNDPRIALWVLRNSPRQVDGWEDFSPGGMSNIKNSRTHRHVVLGKLTSNALKEHFNPMLETCHDLVRLWTREMNTGRSINLKEWCSRFTLAGQGKEFFGTDLFRMGDHHKEQNFKIIDAMGGIFKELSSRITFQSIGFRSRHRLEQYKKRLFNALKPIFVEFWKELQDSFNSGNLDPERIRKLKTFGVTEEILKTGISEERINSDIKNFFGLLQALYETSATAATWLLYELAIHPEIQEKLAKEIKTKLEGNPPKSAEDFPAYLKKVIEELLRLHPPILATTRKNDNPKAFGKTSARVEEKPSRYQTKPGATFIISPQLLNRQGWGDDAEEFNPERFIIKEGLDMTSKKWRRENPTRLFTFINGPQACPGQDFARMKLATLAIFLLQNFKFEVDTEKTPLSVKPTFRITAHPSHPIYVKLTPR